MNKNKLIYEAPEAETLVVRFEGGLMTASNQVKSNSFSERAIVNDQSDAEDWW